MSMLTAALRLALRGLRVFPVDVRGKKPALAKGCLAATADLNVIKGWWGANPLFNIGLACGAGSGIFVIDIDGPDAEVELRRLEAQHGVLPPTVEAITARGRHLYFVWPGRDLRNSAGKIAPGIDVRGAGGYVLAPPSIHPSGRRYCWSVDSANGFAAAPDWLLDLLTVKQVKAATPVAAWQSLVANGVAEGCRNDSIARLAGHLLRRDVNALVTLEICRAWNAVRCRPPLDDGELVGVVDSIAGRELHRRGLA